MRVRLIDGMNCTPVLFREKPLSRELTVPVLETIFRAVCRVCRPSEPWRFAMETAARWQAADAGKRCVVGAVNMGSIVPGQPGGVVSPRFRFFSVCFAACAMQRRRNICCVRRATACSKSAAHGACVGCAHAAYGLKSLCACFRFHEGGFHDRSRQDSSVQTRRHRPHHQP